MRDISAILNDAQVEQLRALLAGQPAAPIAPGEFEHYPRILYRKEWWICERTIRESDDDLLKKLAREKQRRYQIIVRTPLEEERRAFDGWVADLNQLVIDDKDGNPEGRDPRKPEGMEAIMAAQDREEAERMELDALRIRYAQLTKRSIDTDPALRGAKSAPAHTVDDDEEADIEAIRQSRLARAQAAESTKPRGSVPEAGRRGAGAAARRAAVKEAAAQATA